MKKTEKEFYNFILGKSVVLVGPAGYLMEKDMCEFIEKHDVVIRVNHAIPVKYPNSYGIRTDVLYHAMNKTTLNKEIYDDTEETARLWKEEGVKWVITALSEEKPYVKKFGEFFDTIGMQWVALDATFYQRVKNNIGTKLPSTGILALTHLLKSSATIVSLIGFDFYNSGVYPSYGGVDSGIMPEGFQNLWHDGIAQLRYMKRMINQTYVGMPLLQIDDHLQNILCKKLGAKEVKLKTINNMASCIIENLHKIPQDIDLVVGIPRSGLLAATIIAIYLNVPVVSLDGFLHGVRIKVGNYKIKNPKETFESILLVDDVIGTGKEMIEAKKRLAHISKQKIVYCAVYTALGKQNLVDIYFETCSPPRIFQWNMFHHPRYKICWDIDGVMCLDPTKDELSTDKKYKKFIENATPYILPKLPVHAIITGRKEEFRKETEKWLKEHNIVYKTLIMRTDDRRTSDIKAEHYIKQKGDLFIESCTWQAKEIAQKSKRQVFCVENEGVYS